LQLESGIERLFRLYQGDERWGDGGEQRIVGEKNARTEKQEKK